MRRLITAVKIKDILIYVLIYFLIINSIGLTKVVGNSMLPTLKDGSFLLVNKIASYIKKPKVGDIVIIKMNGYNIVKRVVATEGDRIKIENGTVYVNGMPLLEVYCLGKPLDMKEIVVKKERVFVLGDNREIGESLDSRDPKVGQIPVSKIVGYPVMSIFPFYRLSKPLNI